MSEGAEPLIALTRVSKDYISEAAVVRALRDVSLTVERGDFLAIVGTSGSGKSTLMNILGCLDRPTRGTYHLAGLDVGARSNDGRALVRNRLIGFIFQGFNLLPRTTALENVELPLTYRGVPTKDRRRRAMAALDAVGLGDRVHHTPNQLSGGQQQRVAIARALVTDPPLLLADEPTGNLDTRTSYEVLALLQRLNRDLGITICLVTHEHDIAACASRVIVVRDGRIESDTRPEKPLDAAAALAELPPVDAAAAGPADEAFDPAEAARARLGGPVPFAVYGAMLAGLALGAATGLVYDAAILGEVGPVIPGVLGLVGEAWAGARSSKRRLGRPLTNDQRGRVALSYTVATTAVWALLFAWLALPKMPPSRVETLVGGRAVAVLGVIVLIVAATSLLRFLTLAAAASVFARKSRGATRERAAAS